MSTAIAKSEDLTPERVALLKRTLCPDLTNDEMELLAGVARRTGLDPFAKQIYGIKRKGKLTIQTGIDGFRVIAARTGELDGQEGPFWCGEDGVWKDVWVAKEPPVAAKVIVYRKGCRFGFTGIARTSEYSTGEFMWNRMAANQIAKCAESLALRKAFPADLSGLYTSEEMDQADDERSKSVVVEQPRQLQAQPTDADRVRAAVDYFAEQLKGVGARNELVKLYRVYEADVKSGKVPPAAKFAIDGLFAECGKRFPKGDAPDLGQDSPKPKTGEVSGVNAVAH